MSNRLPTIVSPIPRDLRTYLDRLRDILSEQGERRFVTAAELTQTTDVAYMLDLLEGQLTELQLHAALAARIDLIDGPVGTPGTIPYQIATEATARADGDAVGAASLASTAATLQTRINTHMDKLAAGAVDGDTYIQSSNYIPNLQGWRIAGAGDIEMSNALVRGEVIAEAPSGGYARMYSGNFMAYKNVPSVGVVPYKALTHVETGAGANNTLVTIPGYFSAQPKIIVSPASICTYDSTYDGQSQSLTCEARNIVETSPGSMVWQFTPVAQLSLAASTGATVANEPSGTQPGSWTSSTYTTQSGTISITPSVTLASYRGTGTSGGYYYRTVRWCVEYYDTATSLWVGGAWTTTDLGADVGASTVSTATHTFPSAGAWDFRIRCEGSDTGGTFSTGIIYDYSTGSNSRADLVEAIGEYGVYEALDYDLLPYTAPAGWQIYSAQYSITYQLVASAGSMQSAYARVFQQATEIDAVSVDSHGSADTGVVSRSGAYPMGAPTSSLTAHFWVAAYATSGGASDGGSAVIYSVSMTYNLRRAQTNSTTASNAFQFNSYGFSLSASTVLATGTLNWIAVGD